MKRKFVKVMFFGALALSTVTYVGCKDYDDDIKNVQEQIDAINKKGADVTTEAMTAAINSAVAGLQTQLDAIKTKIEALEEADKNFVTISQLNDYMNSEAVKAYVDEALVDYLTSAEVTEQVNAVKTYVDGTFKAAIMAEIKAEYLSLEKYNADMEALMEKIDTYVGKEDAAYKKIFTDITALQTYQQQTIEVLVASLAENNTIENANKIVGALEDITTLQTEIAKCAKTTDLDAYVKVQN